MSRRLRRQGRAYERWARKRLIRHCSRIARREHPDDPLATRTPGWLLAPDALEQWATRRWAGTPPTRQLPLPG